MKVLLLSDNTMNVNDRGFPQTLYNIFCWIAPSDMLCITSAEAYKKSKPTMPFTSSYVTYKFSVAGLPLNRFTRRFKYLENKINYSINHWFRPFKKIQAQIKKFKPDVVVIAPNSAESVFMYFKLKAAFTGCTVIPYFMDDWMQQYPISWAGGNINNLVKNLLSNHRAWMMISKSLGNILSERYNTKPKRQLEIHNPVKLNGEPLLPSFDKKKEYTFAYAGSLWPMHFDALLVICKAISNLQKNHLIKLVIYTEESHWNWRKNELELNGVYYGGNILYKNIHAKLAEADGLIVTSSFSEQWFTHTKGSVQTKITDYMKAARLIIACGPVYSANNEFVKKYNCGVCIETDDIENATRQLDRIINDLPDNQQYIINGIEALKNNFSFEIVHRKLKEFLCNDRTLQSKTPVPN